MARLIISYAVVAYNCEKSTSSASKTSGRDSFAIHERVLLDLYLFFYLYMTQ